jgi:NAD(P)-dependent dehydrogenase (short-subunit alcohol dehydrogenase family)
MQIRKKADISSEKWEEFVGFLDASPLNSVTKTWIPTSQIGLGIVYLASDEAQWVTGTDLVIDGGLTAQ